MLQLMVTAPFHINTASQRVWLDFSHCLARSRATVHMMAGGQPGRASSVQRGEEGQYRPSGKEMASACPFVFEQVYVSVLFRS